MAYVSLDAGEIDAADAESVRCEQICRELEHPIGEAVARVVQVWAAIDRGDSATARALLARTMATAQDSGYRALLAYCVAARAALIAADGEAAGAARILGALDGAGDCIGGEGASVIRTRIERLRADLEARLGSERFRAIAADGAGLTLGEAAATALTS